MRRLRFRALTGVVPAVVFPARRAADRNGMTLLSIFAGDEDGGVGGPNGFTATEPMSFLFLATASRTRGANLIVYRSKSLKQETRAREAVIRACRN
jgi:hypothetical protein